MRRNKNGRSSYFREKVIYRTNFFYHVFNMGVEVILQWHPHLYFYHAHKNNDSLTLPLHLMKNYRIPTCNNAHTHQQKTQYDKRSRTFSQTNRKRKQDHLY